jgi:putative SOS response-associated peptidase YedK
MCGRFESKRVEETLLDLFNYNKLQVKVDSEINNRADEDIRPTQKIVGVLKQDKGYRVAKVNWGIKFSDDSPLIFNSRIETIKEKKFWNTLFSNNKCIVPMTGFYEWKTEGKKKIKYKITVPELKIFFVPALYHKDKEKNLCASLITTTPNSFIKQIHHRMPVILDFNEALKFLTDTTEENLQKCIPLPDSKKMEMELS